MAKLIALTPRQRQTYDAAYAVTEGGTVRWTGVLKVSGVDQRDVHTDMSRLLNLGVLRYERVANSRRIEILVKPDGLTEAPPPVAKYQGKLHAGAILRSGPRITPDEDMSHTGVRKDTGAFSRAFLKALGPNASYRPGAGA